jgi:Protein of unknown function (DUF2924)
MTIHVGNEVAALGRLTVTQLRGRYAEVFGEPTLSKCRTWLTKRIAWRLQALAEGDLSERARQRAAELGRDADLRMTPPREAPVAVAAAAAERTATKALRQQDDRLPSPGTVITRTYKGQQLRVQVLAEGFEYDGQVYGSLSAVARAITGSHCNGYLFFHVGQYGGNR